MAYFALKFEYGEMNSAPFTENFDVYVKAIGSTIRKLRKELKLSQEDVPGHWLTNSLDQPVERGGGKQALDRGGTPTSSLRASKHQFFLPMEIGRMSFSTGLLSIGSVSDAS